LKDYRLAYFINKKLSIILTRDEKDIYIRAKEVETYLVRFLYNSIENDFSCDLIQNHKVVPIKGVINSFSLFDNEVVSMEKKVYLLPEFSEVDFFFKIENSQNLLDIKEIIAIIYSIDEVYKVYKVDLERIKSKNNLIF